jgi:secondary thiamine-phosphate synthase enzyme
MRQATHQISIGTQGKGMYELTGMVRDWVEGSGIRTGLLTLYIQHTSASLLIQENADPEVQRDLERFFTRLVPDGDPLFRHTVEGPDDITAHVRAALTQTHLAIPVTDGKPALGTWQGIFLYEHRREPHQRSVLLTLMGE